MDDEIRITSSVRPSDSNCPDCGVAHPEYGCKCRWENQDGEILSGLNRDLEILRQATNEVDIEVHEKGCECRICGAAITALAMMRKSRGPDYPVESLIAAHKASVIFILGLEAEVGPAITFTRFTEGECVKCGDVAIPNMPYCPNCRGDAMDLVRELKE